MFLIEKLYEFKKWISEKYKMYLTIEGKYTCILPDKMYLKKVYKARMGQKLNLKNPKTFTAKNNWLKLYDRNPLYTIMADKYKAREYIAKKVGEEYLVPLLGVWDSPDEIDFDSLPDKFVLKCNHDNGVIICKDKSKLDIENVKKDLSNRLKRDYYKKYREWSYKNIPRKIICEKYMDNADGCQSVEYKLYCFNGVPRAVLVCSDRTEGLKLDMYDLDWNYLSIQQDRHPMAGDVFVKPDNLSELYKLSKILSKDTPFVRVDFNYWDKKLYFGELTFFDSAGYSDFNPKKWDEILGSWLELPEKRRR